MREEEEGNRGKGEREGAGKGGEKGETELVGEGGREGARRGWGRRRASGRGIRGYDNGGEEKEKR